MKQFEGSTNLWIASGRQPSRRCCIRALVKIAAHGLDEKNVGQSGNYFRRTCASVIQFPQHILCGQSKPLVRAVATGDRKSTRLNSSHVRISYAVFCLKKKKKTKSKRSQKKKKKKQKSQ